MIDYSHSDLFLEDSVDKQTEIVFDGGKLTNSDLYSEEMSLEESLCSESSLRFGACESSVLKFKIGELATSLKGKRITLSQVLANHTTEPFVYGQYIVESDRHNPNQYGREVVAYDDMYRIINADVSEWYNGLTFPLTLKQFRDSFLQYFGITQENVSLVNDNMTVRKTIEPSELSGKQVITSICEINGCFGHIGRNGAFQYKFLQPITDALYPSETLYPSENLFPRADSADERLTKSLYQSLYVEEYNVNPITKVQIRQETNDIGAIYGDGDNCYIVQDNFLCYGMSPEELMTVAQNLYSVIYFVNYAPFQITAKGNPCLEVGDIVKIYTTEQAITTYAINRVLSGIQSLTDEMSASGEEYQPEEVNSVHKAIVQLKGKSATIERNVEGITSRVTDIESGESSIIQQLSNQISAKVSQTGGSTSSFGWSLTATEFRLNSNGRAVFVCNKDGITVSGYADVGDINALSGRIGSLESDHVSVGSLNAVDAKINALSAKAITTDQLTVSKVITTDNLSAQNINADKITAGTLSTSRLDISGIVSAMSVYDLSVDSLSVNSRVSTSQFSTVYINSKKVEWFYDNNYGRYFLAGS